MIAKALIATLVATAVLSFPLLPQSVASPNLKGPASAQVTKGGELYKEFCALCHGDDGKRGAGFQTPIWGDGSLIATKFGNVQGLIDYMLLMPFNDPALLDDNQKLAVVAYMMANHGAIKPGEEIAPAQAASIPVK
jgi:mono/diheme cytochrome c family protein